MARERLSIRFRDLVRGRKIPATLSGVVEAFDCLIDLVESDLDELREEAGLQMSPEDDSPLPPLLPDRGRFDMPAPSKVSDEVSRFVDRVMRADADAVEKILRELFDGDLRCSACGAELEQHELTTHTATGERVVYPSGVGRACKKLPKSPVEVISVVARIE